MMHLSDFTHSRFANSTPARALLRRGIAGPRMIWLYLLLAAALWLFASIAEDVVTADSITSLDQQVSLWLHAHASPALTRITLAFTHVHGIVGILILSVLAGLYVWRKGERFWLAVLALGVPGAALLNVALKQIFQRDRPSFDHPLINLLTYSFPSGHTAGATAFYGIVAAYCLAHGTTPTARGRQAAILITAAVMVALVGLSRMYLGVHFLSDVLAAIAESCAWLALTFLFCEWAYTRLNRQHLDATPNELHENRNG